VGSWVLSVRRSEGKERDLRGHEKAAGPGTWVRRGASRLW
jgi:hypothetical protein